VAIKEPAEVQKKNNVWQGESQILIRKVENKVVWVIGLPATVSLSGLHYSFV
jgi:hypothetical protein